MRPTEEELEEVRRLFDGDFLIPTNFQRTAPVDTKPRNCRSRANLVGIPPSDYYR